MRKLIVTIDPKYVNYIITVDASGKTTVKVSIDKTGLPENAKKVNISYLYLKNNGETTPIKPGPEDPPIVDPDNPDADVPQPNPGTITTVGETITIDENTEYPITGEFEINGTPASIEGEYTTIENGEIRPTYYFGANERNESRYNLEELNDPNSPMYDPNLQLEFIEGFIGGLALRGTKFIEF